MKRGQFATDDELKPIGAAVDRIMAEILMRRCLDMTEEISNLRHALARKQDECDTLHADLRDIRESIEGGVDAADIAAMLAVSSPQDSGQDLTPPFWCCPTDHAS